MKSDTQVKTKNAIVDYNSFGQYKEDKIFHDILKSRKIHTKIYFDAADVIEITAGLTALQKQQNDSERFDLTPFLAQDYLVYGLVFRSYIGQIHLLDAHFFEFVSIKKKITSLFPENQNYSPEDLTNNFYYKVGEKFKDLSFTEKNSNDIEQIIRKIKENYGELFKISYLTKIPHWKKRFEHLAMLEHKILVLPEIAENKNYGNHLRNTLFLELTEALNKKRPDRTMNNRTDAMAFTSLQHELSLYLRNETNKLPLFYSNQYDILEIITTLSEREDLGFPFTYTNENRVRFLIVRDAKFFILHGSDNYELIDKMSGEVFNIDNEHHDYNDERIDHMGLADSVNENVAINFLHNWWNGNGLREILDLFQDDSKEKYILDDELNHRINDYIKREEEIRSSKFKKLWFSQEVWESLINIPELAKQKFNSLQLESIDVYADFGIRYAYSKEMCEKISKRLKSYHRIFTPVREKLDKRLVNDEIMNLVDLLVEGVFNEGYGKDLAEGMAILFLLEKYEEVCLIFEKSKELTESICYSPLTNPTRLRKNFCNYVNESY